VLTSTIGNITKGLILNTSIWKSKFYFVNIKHFCIYRHLYDLVKTVSCVTISECKYFKLNPFTLKEPECSDTFANIFLLKQALGKYMKFCSEYQFETTFLQSLSNFLLYQKNISTNLSGTVSVNGLTYSPSVNNQAVWQICKFLQKCNYLENIWFRVDCDVYIDKSTFKYFENILIPWYFD